MIVPDSAAVFKNQLVTVLAVRASTGVIEFSTGATLAVFTAALTKIGKPSKQNSGWKMALPGGKCRKASGR